ncbi:hypothetical protein CYMTET_41509 [Cymbomonas tetramitiformis]|uniref:Uncharacterized protein n=1 Tax=Cymbomonas tetramitiformis TaxID=36881 RepID=A0AAE0F2G1_9CHLO|nr:hypothetical protein CYMTET_41509 [Cymbomonas tetramitiformis]
MASTKRNCSGPCPAFSDVRHTADELLLATKRACALMGLGAFIEGDSPVDTVADFSHATTSDSANNIVCGWKCFDGHECNCHTIALAVIKYLESPGVAKVFKKLRGMTTHFNHSVIGRHVLHDCQEIYGLTSTSPPQDNATRGGWKGAFIMAEWYLQNQEGVQFYDVEQPKKAPTVVDNPDGSKTPDNGILTIEKKVVVPKAEPKKQLVSFLEESDDAEEVAVVEAVEPETGAEEADCAVHDVVLGNDPS